VLNFAGPVQKLWAGSSHDSRFYADDDCCFSPQ